MAGSKSSVVADYLSIAIKAAGAIAAALAIMKGISEWSAKGRNNRQMEMTVRMAMFAETVAKLCESEAAPPEVQEAKTHAEGKLKEMIAQLYISPKSPPQWRLMSLLYVPRGFQGYISHFFFYLFATILGFGIFSTVQDVIDRSVSIDDFMSLILIAALLILSQRWSIMEWRRRNHITCEPRNIGRGLIWYPPNSLLGFLANFYLITNLLSLVRIILPDTSSPLTALVLIPEWQYPFLLCVVATSFPAAYFWPRVEFQFSSKQLAAIPLKSLHHQLGQSKSAERVVGVIAFVLMTLWVILLIFDFVRIPIAASAPDGSVGTIGVGAAVAAAFVTLALLGVLPWLSVYRGLSALLDVRRVRLGGLQSAAAGRAE